MPIATPFFSRATLTVALVALVATIAAVTSTGGAIFSPGALHAGDSSVVTLGGVTSHAGLAQQCGACHAAPWSRQPMAARCLACHTDIQSELTDSTTLHAGFPEATGCLGCHGEHLGPTGALTRMVGLGAAHAQFGFALDAHRQTAAKQPFICRDCHTAGSFRFAPARCESCHREYQAPFVASHVAAWGRDCQSCHDGRDRFGKNQFSHDTTALPLDGAHTTTDCQVCHTRTSTLAGFAQAPTTCVGCHRKDDRHRGSMGDDCASCHTTRTWEGATFQHDVFPITHGEGGPVPCKTCHDDRTNYKRYTCYGCHEHSPARVQAEHRGEVRTSNLDNCLECHTGGRGDRRREGGDEH